MLRRQADAGQVFGLLPAQVKRLKTLYAPRLDACLAAIDRYMPTAEATP